MALCPWAQVWLFGHLPRQQGLTVCCPFLSLCLRGLSRELSPQSNSAQAPSSLNPIPVGRRHSSFLRPQALIPSHPCHLLAEGTEASPVLMVLKRAGKLMPRGLYFFLGAAVIQDRKPWA